VSESPGEVPSFFDILERAILGETRHLTRVDVARESGVPLERLNTLWRSLGFTAATSDTDVVFVDADVEAVQLLDDLLEFGMIDARSEYAVARSMGRSFARLAEWEIAELASGLAQKELELDDDLVEGLVSQILPVAERLQSYAWRRHLVNAAGRLLLQPDATENGVPMAVGFADIVGFTRHSRRMTGGELADLIEMFESTVTTVIAGHGGRVIKTLGDEVLYAADDAVIAARIALDLAGGQELAEEFPDVRVGVAYGDVLSRMGDVFGEVVNIASRLTSLAKPNRVLVNREMGELLRQHDEFRVRRSRTTTVKGYVRLETWSLKRPRPPAEGADPEKEAQREARRNTRRDAALDVLHSADPAIEALESLADKLTQPRKGRRQPETDDTGPPDHPMP
jgi:adenylate cyclase